VIAPVLQHAVDLMNDRRQLVSATHSRVHAEQPSKSDELLTSHRADDFQVFWHWSLDYWKYWNKCSKRSIGSVGNPGLT